MSRRRQAGLVGAVAGAVALGAAAGLAAERYAIGRSRLAPDPEEGQAFFRLPADRVRRVIADDGVPLHVEEVGPDRADLTVVFCHGYTQQLAVWHYQRIALAQEGVGKLVFWDQRSHGKSGRSAAERTTIDQLGRDLRAVLDACAPTGRVVLVGHSMGGMTIMALADQFPALFGSRVTGVA
ncbi:MAG: alpha/beta fold hydrolase, partial [Mycobacteriales bacterium]